MSGREEDERRVFESLSGNSGNRQRRPRSRTIHENMLTRQSATSRRLTPMEIQDLQTILNLRDDVANETHDLTIGKKENLSRMRKGDLNTECSVCMEDFSPNENLVQLHAQSRPLKNPHLFHEKCIKDWLKHHNTCPLCRGTDLKFGKEMVRKFKYFKKRSSKN